MGHCQVVWPLLTSFMPYAIAARTCAIPMRPNISNGDISTVVDLDRVSPTVILPKQFSVSSVMVPSRLNRPFRKPMFGLTGMTPKIFFCSWPMPRNSKKPSGISTRFVPSCSIQYHWRDSSAHKTIEPFNLQRAAFKVYTSELKHLPITLISQQLQFMHMRAQHGPTSHSTFQLESNPCVAHNQDEPDNTPNGPANKEVGAKTCNHQPNDGKP